MWVIKQEFDVRCNEEEANGSDGETDLIEDQFMLQTINNTVPVCDVPPLNRCSKFGFICLHVTSKTMKYLIVKFLKQEKTHHQLL